MRKVKRIWIKEEKRIVKLLYRKGLIDMPLKELYWAEYYRTNKMYRSSSGKYKHSEYFPEIYYGTTDYWGECDEHSLVDTILQGLYWEHVIDVNADVELGYPESTFKCKSRRWFIKYLSALKTVNFDNKINKLLRQRNIYD